MGKPIAKTRFDNADYSEFRHQLAVETLLLEEYCKAGLLSENTQESGFELELWLLNGDLKPLLQNIEFINQVHEKYLIPEISKSSLEMNLPYDSLHEHALSNHQSKLEAMLNDCYRQANKNKQHLISIGTLPTAVAEDYNKSTLTEQQRYQAMDEYLRICRNHQPVHIQLEGAEKLPVKLETSALVGAMSSFQIHFRTSFAKSVRLYNASQALSAPLVALCANSPFLLGKNIWDESRIAFYEQVLQTKQVLDSFPRVSFGRGYIKNSFVDLFKENYRHYHPIIPQVYEKASEQFYHLRLHNGTIYRWNRPILGIDAQNIPHFRVEFRPVSAGPTAVDMMANAAFYYGITHYYAKRERAIEDELPFKKARENFYAAAQKGLAAKMHWCGKENSLSWLLLQVFLPQAREGLQQLEISSGDIDYYLSIIEERVRKNQTGSQWQKTFSFRNNGDLHALVQAYLEQQYSGRPVHEWLTI